jgi:hypothetical protein
LKEKKVDWEFLRTGYWGKYLDPRERKKLHNLYCSLYMIMVISSRGVRWAGHVAHIRVIRNLYTILVIEPEGKRPLGSPRHRCGNNIKIDLKKNRTWTRFIWLIVGSYCGLLWIW